MGQHRHERGVKDQTEPDDEERLFVHDLDPFNDPVSTINGEGGSTSILNANDRDINDGEGCIARPKQAVKDPYGTKGVIEGWCTNPDMIIIPYGPKNTPIYRGRRSKASQQEKEESPFIRSNRRANSKASGEYEYSKVHTKGIQGSC